MLKVVGVLLDSMAFYSGLNIVMNARHLLRTQAMLVKPLQVCTVGLANVKMPGVFRKKNQHGTVPKQRSVFRIEHTTPNIQAVQKHYSGFNY